MEIIKTENLTKEYGTGQTMVAALDHMNLRIEKGQFVAVIGASGSGKSTLLHMLGGIDRPTSGSVFVDHLDISALDETQLALYRRRKVGLIYQFYNLIPSLIVEKNILLPMLLDNKRPSDERFKSIIKTLGLQKQLQCYPSQLSGGQQQRVAIGRAIIYQPDILLADEPTGNLDRKNTEEIIALLKWSNLQYKQTILLITHDEKVAMAADRVIEIEDGTIISDKERNA